MSTTRMRRSAPRIRWLVALWITAVVIGSGATMATWVFHLDGPFHALANFFYMFSIPGWGLLYLAGRLGMRDDPATIIAANALSWTCWCCLIRYGLMWCDRAPVNRETPLPDSGDEQPADPSRRAFFATGLLGVGALGAAASPAYATLVEPWSLHVKRYRVPIRGLPDGFDGLRLVQFSDPHLGPRVPESFIAKAVARVCELRPDLLVLTGDYIHDGADHIDRAAALFQPMIESARYGAVGVLGNHDWWGDGPRVARALQDRGVRMIDNDRVWLDPGSGKLTENANEHGILFAGLGDLAEDSVNVPAAFRDASARTPRVLLSHQPDAAELSQLTHEHAPRVDLMLSGHTHGGQVRLPLIGTPLVPSDFGSKYAGGLVQGPRFPVIISRGIGMSLLPIRIGVPPEIVEITLIRA